MKILLTLIMLWISYKYTFSDLPTNFFEDVLIQILHIITFVFLAFSLILSNNIIDNLFSFIILYTIFYKIKELIADIIFEIQEYKTNEEKR